jgi:hypothetical protein
MTDHTENSRDPDADKLTAALRAMPVPDPRPGFIDRALLFATKNEATSERTPFKRDGSRERTNIASILFRSETWIGAAAGAAVAFVAAFVFFSVSQPVAKDTGITLALYEMRDIDVLIDSDRDLNGATIRIAVTGGVVLDGFDNEHIVDWQADLKRGSNMLSLPVVARNVGAGQLVAVVEHDGRTRTVIIDLSVNDQESQS